MALGAGIVRPLRRVARAEVGVRGCGAGADHERKRRDNSNNDATLELLTSPAALAVLTARAPGTGDWTGPICEGAAGSSYCTWNGPEDQLVLRVANEAASTGQAHAVHEARFQAPSS